MGSTSPPAPAHQSPTSSAAATTAWFSAPASTTPIIVRPTTNCSSSQSEARFPFRSRKNDHREDAEVKPNTQTGEKSEKREDEPSRDRLPSRAPSFSSRLRVFAVN